METGIASMIFSVLMDSCFGSSSEIDIGSMLKGRHWCYMTKRQVADSEQVFFKLAKLEKSRLLTAFRNYLDFDTVSDKKRLPVKDHNGSILFLRAMDVGVVTRLLFFDEMQSDKKPFGASRNMMKHRVWARPHRGLQQDAGRIAAFPTVVGYD